MPRHPAETPAAHLSRLRDRSGVCYRAMETRASFALPSRRNALRPRVRVLLERWGRLCELCNALPPRGDGARAGRLVGVGR